MFLQDPSQVDGAHKRVPQQLNALTRPELGRRTTQKSTITNKCSYKTQGKSTEHTKALNRPEPGGRSTQKSTTISKCSYKTQTKSTELTEVYHNKQIFLQDPKQVEGASKMVGKNLSFCDA